MSAAASVGIPARLRRISASRDVRWALGLTLLALAVRLAFTLAFGRTDTFDEHATGIPFNDTLFYRWVGEALINGDGYTIFGQQTVHWPPGYPFALAGFFAIFGASARNALVLNSILGAATVAFVYVIALRAFGRRAAIGAAALLAIFPGQILMGDVILSETLYAFLLTGFVALAAVLDRRVRSLVLLGVVAGLAALTRGEGFLFPLVVLAMAWGRGTGRVAWRQTAIVAVVMLLVVAPWTIRNATVAHSFVPVSTNATSTLWAGHNPNANGEAVQIFNVPTHGLKGARGEVEGARVLRKRAIDYAVHHPAEELKLIPKKLRALVQSDANFITVWIDPHGQHPLSGTAESVTRALAKAFWFALLLATLATVALFLRTLWRNPLARAVLLFCSTAIPLYGFVYYGNFRYRMPLEPLMIVLAAGGATLARRAQGHARTADSPLNPTGGSVSFRQT